MKKQFRYTNKNIFYFSTGSRPAKLCISRPKLLPCSKFHKEWKSFNKCLKILRVSQIQDVKIQRNACLLYLRCQWHGTNCIIEQSSKPIIIDQDFPGFCPKYPVNFLLPIFPNETTTKLAISVFEFSVCCFIFEKN